MNQPAPGAAAQEPKRFISYGVGFVASVFLTAVPFLLVIEGWAPRSMTIFLVFCAAFVQVLVHLRYFLHLNASPESRLLMSALALTVLIAILIISGTAWIMHHLSYNLSG